MDSLNVFIEINGKQNKVGTITGESYKTAVFTYDQDYISSGASRPISVNLPIKEEPFSPETTKIFFESLLPEGFSRKSVAQRIKANEDDYVTILENLGKECIGAIQISKGDRITGGNYKPISDSELAQLAKEGATKSTELLMESHISLAGASGKVGLYLDKNNNRWYQPNGISASTHIIKQSHVRLDNLVLNEQLCMLSASKLSIDVPNSFIINMGKGRDGEVLFATERFDRLKKDDCDKPCSPYRLHQEDFAQALGIPSSEKYEVEDKGYLGRMFSLINNYSSNPMDDGLKLWDRVIFNYLIGNTDAHVKNYGIVYDKNLKSFRLAPAYDMLCTRIYGNRNELSIMINGTLDCTKLTRKSFENEARRLHIGQKVAMDHYDYLYENLKSSLKESMIDLKHQGFEDVDELGQRILNKGIMVI